MLCLAEIEELLAQAPSGYKPPEDVFFAAANAQLYTYRKLGVLTEKDPNDAAPSAHESNKSRMDDETMDEEQHKNQMHCNEHGCCMVFSNIADYNSHYNNQHRYNCMHCHYTLPTAHLLDLHISERHDNYFAACVERGQKPMYQCLLAECDVRSQTVEERKDHCIKAHKFPTNYRFNKLGPKTPATCATTLAASGGGKIKKPAKISSQDNSEAMELDEAASSVQQQQLKAPKSIMFGHQRMRTFENSAKNTRDNRKARTSAVEHMDDLKEALNNI